MEGYFWWRSMLKILTTYKGINSATVGLGDTTLFWKDLWNGKILQLSYPQLFSFVVNENTTVAGVYFMEFIQDHFTLPLSKEAYDQYLELNLWLQIVQITEESDV
jgi:hypothetical protein